MTLPPGWTVVNGDTPGVLVIQKGDFVIRVYRDLSVAIESARFGRVMADARLVIVGGEILNQVLTERYGRSV